MAAAVAASAAAVTKKWAAAAVGKPRRAAERPHTRLACRGESAGVVPLLWWARLATGGHPEATKRSRGLMGGFHLHHEQVLSHTNRQLEVRPRYCSGAGAWTIWHGTAAAAVIGRAPATTPSPPPSADGNGHPWMAIRPRVDGWVPQRLGTAAATPHTPSERRVADGERHTPMVHGGAGVRGRGAGGPGRRRRGAAAQAAQRVPRGTTDGHGACGARPRSGAPRTLSIRHPRDQWS